MEKLKRISLILLLSPILLISCSDDEGGKSFSLDSPENVANYNSAIYKPLRADSLTINVDASDAINVVYKSFDFAFSFAAENTEELKTAYAEAEVKVNEKVAEQKRQSDLTAQQKDAPAGVVLAGLFNASELRAFNEELALAKEEKNNLAEQLQDSVITIVVNCYSSIYVDTVGLRHVERYVNPADDELVINGETRTFANDPAILLGDFVVNGVPDRILDQEGFNRDILRDRLVQASPDADEATIETALNEQIGAFPIEVSESYLAFIDVRSGKIAFDSDRSERTAQSVDGDIDITQDETDPLKFNIQINVELGGGSILSANFTDTFKLVDNSGL